MMKRNALIFDQHFLTDAVIKEKMLGEANLSENDVVIEIGSGNGVLSADIAKRVQRLFCIEIDPSMGKPLNSLQRMHTNVEVIYGNILDIELPSCTKIISNLPFSIIEPFIRRLIDCRFEQAILIVGDRFASGVIASRINRLSMLTNCFFVCEKIAEIQPSSFDPKPRVLSDLIRLRKKRAEDIADDVLLLFRFMFLYNGSKVKNAIRESLIKLYALKERILTKRESVQLTARLTLSDNILEKQFQLCTNEELKLLHKEIITKFGRVFNTQIN